jgi:hypothetical protein
MLELTDIYRVLKDLPHLEAVVRVLDVALCEADVTEVDLVKDHSLKDIGVLLKHSTLHPLCQTPGVEWVHGLCDGS